MSAQAAQLLRNPRTLLIIGGVIVAVLAAKQLKDFLAGILGPLARGADSALDGIANAYVNAMHDGVQLAAGNVYVLPGGATVKVEMVTPAGGGKFRWQGVLYMPVESLGNGSYRAIKV